MASSGAATPVEVLVAGGGPAAVETLLALRDLADERVSLTLVAPGTHLELKPMLIAAPFGAEHARRYPLAALAEPAGARLVQATLERVLPREREAVLGDGSHRRYDELVVATGAHRAPWLAGAVTIATGSGDGLAGLLVELEQGATPTVTLVVPAGETWPLPLYELALLTAARLRALATPGARISILTPEPAPLALFGADASATVQGLLDEVGVAFRGGTEVLAFDGRRLTLAHGEHVPADHVVTLPRLTGRRTPGLPADEDGFLPVDTHGRVQGVEHVFAAGDGTDQPVKQGGLACRQADAVARAIAAAAGARVAAEPMDPVLRGKLLTGRGAAYLLTSLREPAEQAWSGEQLWWPPTKISARYLSPRLAALDGPRGEREQPLAPPAPQEDGVDVEVALQRDPRRRGMLLDPYSP